MPAQQQQPSDEAVNAVRNAGLSWPRSAEEREAILCAIFNSMSPVDQIAWIERAGGPPPGWKPKD